ncbi:putative capsid protein [Fig cryptic virus]|uniref:Putative capsid protein n=1 Tax=Fig cryptic virus TaxID=882768 RepID=F4MST4_9VIRU|nr:putative capsid protein [Fig cryptic virus]CBW77437.1 putative capsid protein [Fig cryptic virus]
MAAPNFDILEDLIADGRLQITPYVTSTEPKIFDVDFDALWNRINAIIVPIYTNWDQLRFHYPGTTTTVTNNITLDVGHLVTFALWQLYNRLRSVAECFHHPTRTSRMNTRAPISNRMEFPSFLSSMLESISWLRINDGPVDYLALFTAPTGTSNNYGRSTVQVPDNGCYDRLTGKLRALGVQLTPIDMTPSAGSFWPTTQVITEEELYNIVGTFHSSHYVNEDAIRAIFLAGTAHSQPFPDFGMTVGFVTDRTVMDPLAALAAPTGTPRSEEATSAGRPVHGMYNVNHRGIQPAAGEQNPSGCYIIGRGYERRYTCYLARRIAVFEANRIIRYRFMR